MEYKLCRPDELYHYGVLGMKWGVRRYQNKDGTLTARGKERLDKESSRLAKAEQVMKNRKETKAKTDQLAARRKAIDDDKKRLKGEDPEKPRKKKSMKEMSDAELKAAVQRAQMEQQYLQYQAQIAEANAKKASAGKKFLKGVIDDVVVPAAKNVGKSWLENTMKKNMGFDKDDKVDLKDLVDEFRKIGEEERKDIKDAAQFYENVSKVMKKGRDYDPD